MGFDYPSYWAFAVSGFIIAYVVAMLIWSTVIGRPIDDASSYSFNMLLLVLSIAIGVHGIGHVYAERFYGFNPLKGRWSYALL